jgi:hypothetical protein
MTGAAGTGRDAEPPGRSLEVEPTRLLGSGGGRGRAVTVVGAIALLLAGAVGLAQRGSEPRDRTAVAPATTATVVASVAPTAGPAADVLHATSVRVSAAALAAGVHDGSLDGRLVFVDGTLSAAPVDCRNLAAVRRGCHDLEIAGVGVPVHAADPSVVSRPGPPLGAWLVTVVRADGLVYLGSLVPRRDVPASIAELERQLADQAKPAGSLFQANGTLVTNIPSPCNNLCPPPPPYLADEASWDNPALPETGTVVDVVRDAPEIPLDTERFDGTFLLAPTKDGGRWRVVARYVPANAVRVLVP